jgi:Undecaprenyl-phosphate glucose phosphotransferase
LVLARRLARALLRLARRRGYNLRFALIIGAGALGQEIARRLRQHPEFGIKIAGFLTRHPEKIGLELAGAPVLGLYDDLERVLKDRPVDQVFFALPLRDQWRIEELFRPVVDGVYDVKVVPDLLHFMTLRGAAEMLDGLPVISMQHSPLAGWNSVAKRGLDVAFSLLVLAATAPLLLLIALAIKLDSPGPVFFRQQRMGLDGKLFEMLKFRSMRADAEADSGPTWAVQDDPRRTPLGRLLRATSLDELPQFINVLRGEMSVVGPRPERPEFVAQFRKSVPKYMLRHMIKAGITGLAQVKGWRGNTSIEERIKCDLEYIENWSLLLDLKIMCVTLWRGFINRSAY